MKRSSPRSKGIEPYLEDADYVDVFAYDIPAGKHVSPEEMLISFFTDMPAWADALFRLRNRLVRLVGLDGKKEGDFAEIVHKGEPHNGNSFPLKTDDEIVMLMHDKHLDTHLSIALFPAEKGGGQTVEATTVVHYNNGLGRFYFFFVGPFHRIIVPATLKRCLRK